ncbi:MAG: GrrA/OscA1 family cyclophane-containing rSAM-modified RiPP, partial [Cyanobium sp.]
MAFLSRSRLFGLLLILASLPMDPGSALATGMAAPGGDGTRSGDPGESAPADVMEARLRRIAAAVQAQRPQDGSGAVDDDALSYVYVGPGGVGWGNGGWGNGGFRNGGFYNGGFGNG